MNQKARTIIFCISGLLILTGAALFITEWVLAPYLFAVGAAGMALSFLTINVKDLELREKRLHNLKVLASLFLIVASGFMFNNRNEWIVCTTISAIMLLYSSFISKQ